MGYCMDYWRVLERNDLRGDYVGINSPAIVRVRGAIAGDLRRLEHDQRDDMHLEHYARIAGITKEQARAVLDAFLSDKGCVHIRGMGESNASE